MHGSHVHGQGNEEDAVDNCLAMMVMGQCSKYETNMLR